MNDIDNSQDTLDVRDIIERFTELREEREPLSATMESKTPGTEEYETATEAIDDFDYNCEYPALRDLLDDLCGNGGDEQWEGHWYPVTLIRDSYFQDYAEQLADDIGAINSDATWPNNCIDWERAARELRTDYSAVKYDGVTYWYR